MDIRNDDCVNALEKIENNIANLGKKNLNQDTNIEQINKSVYETKEKVVELDKKVEVLDKKVDKGLSQVNYEIKKHFDNISNGGFNPKSIQDLRTQIKDMNTWLMDSYKLQAEKDKILLALKTQKETTKRTKFNFWKAILVAGITVLGVKICEWLSAII